MFFNFDFKVSSLSCTSCCLCWSWHFSQGSKLYAGMTPQTPQSPSISATKGGYDRYGVVNLSMSSQPNGINVGSLESPNNQQNKPGIPMIPLSGSRLQSDDMEMGQMEQVQSGVGLDYGDVVYGQCLGIVFGMVDEAVSHHIAEKSLVGFYQSDLFSVKSAQYVERCCSSLFVSDSEKPWKPLSCMIIFLCRMALSPQSANVSRLRERSCRYCTRLLEKIIETTTQEDYVMRMPLSFKFLLRRTVARTIVYNLCNSNQVWSWLCDQRFFWMITVFWDK